MSTNFYTILGCSETASREEIKHNYQKLAKQFHPDKQSEMHENFLKIDEAWKTLRDEDLRRQYDSVLLQEKLNEQYLVYAHLNANDLEFNSNSLFNYPCRCGNFYVIDKNALKEQSVIECEECSYVIVIDNKSF